ncbi:protein of unknown function [Cupriavidus taiwanensis]|uniref:Uncharacterized protein n=2 Tax=Cupriavidus taiwanensis TaxID=164546 RepID=A0A9Q7UXG2_9BURK|nr:protein of unknown function [Cupriavidus taiwanensis]
MYYVRNIERLNEWETHVMTLCTVLINFGKFSESLEPFTRLIDPTRTLGSHLSVGVANGGYKRYVAALDQCQKAMAMDIHPVNEGQIRAVADIMDANGDTDEDIARAMDFAGDILREHGYLYLGVQHKVNPVREPVDGGHPYFGMRIAVAVSEDEAFEMTCDYAERLAQSKVKIPSSLVLSFEPGSVHAE